MASRISVFSGRWWEMDAMAGRNRPITIDGSAGEGGGQILRTSLSLSMITGRPFRIVKLRQNRSKPGLRPQHLAAVQAAAALCGAEVAGGEVGSRELMFTPGEKAPEDLAVDIGTAGATALVLQTLQLPIALRAEGPVLLRLDGGTFNDKAPSFPFVSTTWRDYLAMTGLAISLAMPHAGFYPRGGGRLDAWIEPGTPRAITLIDRPPLAKITGIAATCALSGRSIAERLRDQAALRLAEHGLNAEIEIETVEMPGDSPGAVLSLSAHHGTVGSTFVSLGRRGVPSERIADEAVAELLAFEDSAGAVDLHSADQILLPLALAEGRSVYSVAAVDEHLRTNVATIAALLDRPITIEPPTENHPARVVIDGSRPR
jgi:RNA 3'-terminal phosphate cyclase (ATP)